MESLENININEGKQKEVAEDLTQADRMIKNLFEIDMTNIEMVDLRHIIEQVLLEGSSNEVTKEEIDKMSLDELYELQKRDSFSAVNPVTESIARFMHKNYDKDPGEIYPYLIGEKEVPEKTKEGFAKIQDKEHLV
jgi:hypothetical protein